MGREEQLLALLFRRRGGQTVVRERGRYRRRQIMTHKSIKDVLISMMDEHSQEMVGGSMTGKSWTGKAIRRERFAELADEIIRTTDMSGTKSLRSSYSDDRILEMERELAALRKDHEETNALFRMISKRVLL